jgi:hypothetical protein
MQNMALSALLRRIPACRDNAHVGSAGGLPSAKTEEVMFVHL